MELKAWFSAYQEAHQPSAQWSAEADRAVRMARWVYQATGDAEARAYILRWAEKLTEGEGCSTDCWLPLFFALQETGEQRYRDAIEAVMAQLGRNPAEDAPFAELPFRMAYEMKLGGMEKVGLTAAAFRRAHQARWDAVRGLFGEGIAETVQYLTALMDAIETCSDQLYEHWRALVDLYRAALKGALAAECAEDAAALMLCDALLRGVKRGIIDPERYLPIARVRLSVMKDGGCEAATAMLEMEGGAF